MNFESAIVKVLKWEGGYNSDPLDKGGETNMGISHKAYPNEDIKGMTVERAKEIYKRDYWTPAKCEELPEHLRGIHLDTAVNCGVHRAANILQGATTLTRDGIIGPKTLEAAKHVTVQQYADSRLMWYDAIIHATPTQERFRKGWTARTLSWV